MRPIDYAQHNAEIKTVWDAYYKHEPIRVPIILGINLPPGVPIENLWVMYEAGKAYGWYG